MDTQGKGMIYIPDRTKQDEPRFHLTTQNAVQLKIYELVLSRISH